MPVVVSGEELPVGFDVEEELDSREFNMYSSVARMMALRELTVRCGSGIVYLDLGTIRLEVVIARFVSRNFGA